MAATDGYDCVAGRATMRRAVRMAGLLGGLAMLAGCQLYSPYRDANGRANDDMAGVINTYQQLGARPVSTLTVAQARAQPTPDDAMRKVVSVQMGQGFTANAFTRERDLTVDGAAGALAARLYDATPGHPGEPIVLYFHGGGWVTGDQTTDDATARVLAVQAHAMVLSVAYRLAPENRFPSAHDDAFAAYRWLQTHAVELGADPRRIAVAGSGAGGNLAINVAMAARDAHMPAPVHALLIDPVAGTDLIEPSYIADEYAVPLGRADMLWYFGNELGRQADSEDPRLALVGKADLHGLPPTTVISAEIDPLESDGRFLTAKLQGEGVQVARTEYGGTTHGFFGMGPAVERARDAEAFAAQQLDATFDKIGNPPAPRVAAAHHQAPRRSAVHRVRGS